MHWQPLDLSPNASRDAQKLVLRLNGLGSLYFFEKYILGRDKLSANFHKPILESLEVPRHRFLLEAPRDHYKTVMVTEGRTMWRALPFNEADEAAMRGLDYDDAWIAWMKETHNPARRTLIVSEALTNAIKIGLRFDYHYQDNAIFRAVFSDIIPTSKEIWAQETKTHNAHKGPNGEGTFDFLGVGGALQSRHYHDVTEDDTIGKDALESEIVMTKTIDYHKLLIGAFYSYREGNWTVVNNRWAPNDLSGWIRKNQKEFVIESHGALGGCCPRHPPGVPVFPEEFTLETLAEIRKIQGPYFFSHQYLNQAVNPEECVFKPEWLRFYTAAPSPYGPDKKWIAHKPFTNHDGTTEVLPTINPQHLIRSLIVDPNHAGKSGRCRHAIVVTGLDPETDRIYLLDVWAASQSFDDLMIQVYKLAEKWGLVSMWLETVAAQKILKYHIEYRNKVEGRVLEVKPLKSDMGANAKRTRIESLEPILKDGRLWVAETGQEQFLEEYDAYPGGLTVDILDALGYGPQTWGAFHSKGIAEMQQRHRDRWKAHKSMTGY